MQLHNLKHRIVAILLALAIFNFNLVILPAQAEGCACDHPHGDGEFACYCGVSKKPACHSGPSISKRECGLEHNSNEFYVPANDHPSVISSDGYFDLHLFVSILTDAGNNSLTGVDLPPTERPPSIL